MSKAESATAKIDKQIEKLQQERSAALANGLPTAEMDVQIRELRGQKVAIEEERQQQQ